VTSADAGLVVWDVDGTLIPADLRWLRRAVARTFQLAEPAVVFPSAKVHGYTDESIVIDTAVCSGVAQDVAESGIAKFHEVLVEVMDGGREELARVQPAYPGARETIRSLHDAGFVQTVLTGNLRSAALVKLSVAGLDDCLDLDIGGFGSDARDRFELPAVIERRFRAAYGRMLDPSSAVVIGDAPNDIACARHAGFHAVVVAHRASRDELAEHHPDVILDELVPGEVVAAVTSLVAQR
jgi:phosphoglycolate phosphatase-like HAD superfamily hydrolase